MTWTQWLLEEAPPVQMKGPNQEPVKWDPQAPEGPRWCYIDSKTNILSITFSGVGGSQQDRSRLVREIESLIMLLWITIPPGSKPQLHTGLLVLQTYFFPIILYLKSGPSQHISFC